MELRENRYKGFRYYDKKREGKGCLVKKKKHSKCNDLLIKRKNCLKQGECLVIRIKASLLRGKHHSNEWFQRSESAEERSSASVTKMK